MFADTIYSIVTLAQKMNINLDKAMSEKIERMEAQGMQAEEGL